MLKERGLLVNVSKQSDPGSWGRERSGSSSERIKVAIRVDEISEGENIGEEGDKGHN